jgi:hypothetical protein
MDESLQTSRHPRMLRPFPAIESVYAQAFGMVIACVVGYGFDISASRETLLQRAEPGRLSELVSGVLGAKSLLSLSSIASALEIGRRVFSDLSIFVLTRKLIDQSIAVTAESRYYCDCSILLNNAFNVSEQQLSVA